MIADVEIVDELRLTLFRHLGKSLYLDTYFIITQKIIIEVMSQDNTVIPQRNMFLTLIRNVVLPEKHLTRILINPFSETTT